MENVRNYFNAEKHESAVFVVIGILAIIIATYFVVSNKTTFYKGMAIPLFSIALIQLIVGSTVWLRSPKDINRMEIILTNKSHKIHTEEIPRMKTVLNNFVVYRYIEITLLAVGLVCMFAFNSNSGIRGVGYGLFIQSVIMLSLDFFAEERAVFYLDYLKRLS